MEESTSREKVLKRVRNALIYKTDNPYAQVDMESSVYAPMEESLDVNFAQEFTKVGGQFVYCEGDEDLADAIASLAAELNWQEVFCADAGIQYLLTQAGVPFQSDPDSFKNLKVGITGCEFLVSRLGSIMISSKQDSGRRLNVYPETHVVIAYTNQLVPDLKDAFASLREKYPSRIPSMISVITGPSRTADIEKTLIMGAHGPKEVFVFLVESPEDPSEPVE
ncbi:MAG: lactate utilization protein [Bacteroidales bacterium]|nr:lactate utilization protein [Bacteroidales bacterium]